MDTKYYLSDGHYWKLDVDYDDYPLNPREDYDCFSHIWAWNKERYRSFSIADENNYDDAEEAIRDLVRDNISEKQLISFIRRNKTRMSVYYDRHERTWKLYSKYTYNSSFFGYKAGDVFLLDTDTHLDCLVDSMIDELTAAESYLLLSEYADIFVLPVYVNDYGCNGIKIHTGNSMIDFDDCDGIAWTDKKTVSDCMMSEKDWKENALTIIEQEVKTYDLYLQGMCYFANWSIYNPDLGDFEDYESVGGFLSDEYGDELFQEIAGTTAKMYDSFKDLYKSIA